MCGMAGRSWAMVPGRCPDVHLASAANYTIVDFFEPDAKKTWNVHSSRVWLIIMNKREDILNASLKLLVEHGEQASSMKWIAQEANCGIGTMYNYFPSKETLINEVYLYVKDKKADFINDGYDNTESIKQQFIHCWTRVIQFSKENPVAYKFLEKFALSPIITEKTRKEALRFFLPIMEIYETGKQKGIIKNWDTFELVLFTNGALSSIIFHNKEIDADKIHEIILLAWDAVKR